MKRDLPEELRGLEAGSVVAVVIRPSSSCSGIDGFDGEAGAWRVRVKSPPVGNRANEELLKLMRRAVGSPVEIVSGKTSKKKLLRVL